MKSQAKFTLLLSGNPVYKVHIPILTEERNVGLVNYGIKIKGKDNITNVSWNVILNKNFDFFLPADALANTKK